MRFYRQLLSVAVALSAASCVRLTPPAPPVPSSEVPIRASFGRAWEAVIDLFSEQNISIVTIERASGIVVAEPGRLDVPWETAFSYADCGRLGRAVFAPTRVGYNVRVKGDSTRSTVRINAVFRSLDPESAKECTTRNVWESKISALIKTKAEEVK